MNEADKITIKEYVDVLFREKEKFLCEFEKRIQNTFNHLEKAVILAKENLDKKLLEMNEVRAEIEERSRHFADKKEQDLQNDWFSKEIINLKQQRAMIDGKTFVWILVVVALVSTVINIILK